ncbi:hypothetical protein RclHR1_03760012 [Rhizophagus clarus]|uniref:Uncharacterized protein n=1 Tax=Rhizophagus clarus TaxID=94130 RepID=A0A2Z6RCD1_9GLOM|nr:hypothetical protein RclHR1_03760012 [Rhizophagus clarus]
MDEQQDEQDEQQQVFNLLNLINDNNVSRLPYNNNANDLAIHIRNDVSMTGVFASITGESLLRQNMEHEAHLNNQHNQHIIDLAADVFWNTRLSYQQRNQFTNLANDVNDINEIHFQASNDTHIRIYQLDDQHGSDIFGGIGFN